MATKTLYLGAGVSTFDSVLDYKVDYIDDKQVNKATFKVYDDLEVQSGDTILFYDNNSVLQFKGKCKEVNPLEGDDSGISELVCYTFEIELTERTITEVFLNQVLEDFIESIVTTYSSLNFATTLTTGVTVDYYLADKKPAFDLVKDLLNRSDQLTYYIDYTTDTFHLIRKGDTQSSTSLIQRDNAVFESGWKGISDKQVTVLNLTGGSEVRNGYSEAFDGTGAQTTFTLGFAPSNVKVVVGSVEQDLEVSGQNTGDYTVVAKDKQIIFKAGSIPASGTGNVVVTYDYGIPIDLSGIEAEPELITQYGRIERTITRDHLKSINDALDYGYEYVNKWAKPVYGNSARIISSVDASLYIPGNKIFVQDTDHKIEGDTVSQFFIIKQVSYSQEGLIITVGEIRSNVMDFLKELKYNVNQLEASNINSSVINKSYFLSDIINITATDEIELQLVQELPTDSLYLFDEIDGLDGWWKGNGDSLDYSVNVNTGTWNGTEAYATGIQFDEAFDFDGINSYIALNSETSISTLGGSISLWINPAVATTNFFIGDGIGFKNWFGINLNAYTFSLDSAEHHNGGTPTPNVLTNVILVFDNNEYYIYENGVVVTSGTISATSSLIIKQIGGIPTLSNYFKGLMGDVRIYNKGLSITEANSIYNSGLGLIGSANIEEIGLGEDRVLCDEISGLVFWSKLDGNAIDYSGYNNNGTWSGTEAYDVGKQFDLGADLDGASTINLPVDINGSGSFSISSWVYWNTLVTATEQRILSSSGATDKLYIRKNTSGVIDIFINGLSDTYFSSGFTPVINTWYNIVLVYDGSTKYIYINNVLRNSENATGNISVDSSINLGSNRAGSGAFMIADVNDVRIYNKGLSANERTRIYNSGLGIVDNAINEDGGVLQDIHYVFSDGNIHNLNPDSEIPNLESYYDLNGDSVDSVGGNDGTDTDITYVTGKVGQAASFNGSTSGINIGTFTGSQTKTIMMWVNSSSISTTQRLISRGSGAGNDFMIQLYQSKIRVVIGNDGGGQFVGSQTSTLLSSTWYHIAAIFDDDNDLLKTYINGELVLADTTTTTLSASALLTRIGVHSDGVGESFNGLIDDVLIVSRIVTTDEIKARYNEGSGKTDKYGSWETIQ